MLDDKAAPIAVSQPAVAARETVHGPFVLPLTGWQYVVLGRSRRAVGRVGVLVRHAGRGPDVARWHCRPGLLRRQVVVAAAPAPALPAPARLARAGADAGTDDRRTAA
ncbi:MAG: hypothetical protein WDN69_10900 [Aliidongia sp.]